MSLTFLQLAVKLNEVGEETPPPPLPSSTDVPPPVDPNSSPPPPDMGMNPPATPPMEKKEIEVSNVWDAIKKALKGKKPEKFEKVPEPPKQSPKSLLK